MYEDTSKNIYQTIIVQGPEIEVPDQLDIILTSMKN